jgi:hypothetical protein
VAQKMASDRRLYKLRNNSWVLPGLPWGFGAMYLFLSVAEAPFRPDLLIAGSLATAFGFLCLASNLTSRVLLTASVVDVRDYGVRRVLHLTDVTAVYTIPSTFSTIVAFKARGAKDVKIHLGYWKDEAVMLKTMAQVVVAHNIPCSPKASRLLKLEPANVSDATKPSLEEGVLALLWILTSSAVPLLIGTLLA